MTNNNHPITPPLKLVEKFALHAMETARCSPDVTISFATQLAQWGYEQRAANVPNELQKARDEGLEACCEWLRRNWPSIPIENLRADLCPKPKSLSESALEGQANG